MRRALTLVIPALILAACGSSDSSSSTTLETTGTTETTASTDESSVETTATTASASTVPIDLAEPTHPPLSSVALPADCPERTPTSTVPPLPDPVEKPEIELPDPVPTELKITDLTEGEGREAAAGDQISVYYVGVLSKDGTEFDSNFGSGAPFSIVLGTGSVIPGWDEGLIGAQPGTRRQLDIPPDMAYGETGSGSIGPNEALTFIVDVVAVESAPPSPPAADPASAPDYEFKNAEAGAEFSTVDVVEGDKCEVAQPGDNVFVNAITVRGDTLEVLDNTWEQGQAYSVILNDDTVYGFAEGIIGMGVGGQRLITMPPAYGFGEAGNAAQGLEPDTVLLVLIELEGIEGVTELDDAATAPESGESDSTSADTTNPDSTTEPATTTEP